MSDLESGSKMEKGFVADKILKERCEGANGKYLIRWSEYGDNDYTWKLDHLDKCGKETAKYAGKRDEDRSQSATSVPNSFQAAQGSLRFTQKVKVSNKRKDSVNVSGIEMNEVVEKVLQSGKRHTRSNPSAEPLKSLDDISNDKKEKLRHDKRIERMEFAEVPASQLKPTIHLRAPIAFKIMPPFDINERNCFDDFLLQVLIQRNYVKGSELEIMDEEIKTLLEIRNGEMEKARNETIPTSRVATTDLSKRSCGTQTSPVCNEPRVEEIILPLSERSIPSVVIAHELNEVEMEVGDGRVSQHPASIPNFETVMESLNCIQEKQPFKENEDIKVADNANARKGSTSARVSKRLLCASSTSKKIAKSSEKKGEAKPEKLRKLRATPHHSVQPTMRKVLKCPHPNCNKAFPYTSMTKLHYERMHMDDNYACVYSKCAYKGEVSNVTRHLKLMHGIINKRPKKLLDLPHGLFDLS